MNTALLFWILGLLAVNLLVTAARAGLLNIQYARLVSMQEDKKIASTVELVTRRAQLRSTFKLAQAVLRFSIAGVVLVMFSPQDLNPLPVLHLISILLVSGILIWLLEFIIERIILLDPETWAVRLTPQAKALVLLFSPILALPLRLSNSDRSIHNLVTITEDELKSLVNASQLAGEIDRDESEMIQSVFRFDDTLVREIMVPRVDMLTFEVNTPLGEAADVVLESGFSRVPVFEENNDNIIGMLYTKDMLKVWREGNGIDSLRELLRAAYFIPETKKVDELLDEMQARRIHISVVVDEYGGVSGLVTLEDIVEEIFGEIEDEFDEEEEALFEQVSPDEYIFRGQVLLDEVNEVMKVKLAADDADTLGGLIYTRTGRVPRKGEELHEKGLVLTVEQLNGRRIGKVRVTRAAASSPQEKEDQTDHADG